MAVLYLDTSALVKRYVVEAGTSTVRGLLDPALDNAVFIATATAVEVASAVSRRLRSGALSASEAARILDAFDADLVSQYAVIELAEDVVRQARDLSMRHAMRAYDAIQLASSLTVHAQSLALGHGPVTLVCADAALNASAVAEGLAVEDPSIQV